VNETMSTDDVRRLESELARAREQIDALQVSQIRAVDAARAEAQHLLEDELAHLREEREAARKSFGQVETDLWQHVGGLHGKLTEQRAAAEIAFKAERWRLYRMAQTLRTLLLASEAETVQLQTALSEAEAQAGRDRDEAEARDSSAKREAEAQGAAAKKHAMELSTKWAEAEYQRKVVASEAQAALSEAAALRERLLAAELKRNRLFVDVQLIRAEREELVAEVAQLAEPIGFSEQPDEAAFAGADLATGEPIEGSASADTEPSHDQTVFAPKGRLRSTAFHLVRRARHRAARALRRLDLALRSGREPADGGATSPHREGPDEGDAASSRSLA